MAIRYCTKCWVPETRPRVTFNKNGVCNACQWNEEKKKVDWKKRQTHLKGLCDKYRTTGTQPDVVVPYSGGKDSIYVAYKMKDLGMTPLLMTVMPHLETEVGEWNRVHMCPGMKRWEINLKDEKYKRLAKEYFISQGRPKHPWECAISAVVISQSTELGIPFIMYGEEGEAEYGGSTQEKNRWMKPVSKEYLKKFYYQNGQLDWAMTGSDDTYFTQYSRYENWSPSTHANWAISKGMRTVPVRSVGTYTSHSQLSDKLQDLHAYLMYIKFGFGRATSDACIAIREGWSDREEGLEWIENYDGEFPTSMLEDYLEYFDMDEAEFTQVIAKHANPILMEHTYKYVWTLRRPLAKLRRDRTEVSVISPGRYD